MYVAFENKCIWFCCAISFWEDEWFPTLLKGGAWLAIVIYNSMGGACTVATGVSTQRPRDPRDYLGLQFWGQRSLKVFYLGNKPKKRFLKLKQRTPPKRKLIFGGSLMTKLGLDFYIFWSMQPQCAWQTSEG